MKKQPHILQPLIDHCVEVRGFKSKVLHLLNDGGNKATFARVSSWLHPKPSRRQKPHPENMKALLAIQKTFV